MSKYTDDRLQDRLGANKMAYEMEVEYNDTKLRRRIVDKDEIDKMVEAHRQASWRHGFLCGFAWAALAVILAAGICAAWAIAHQPAKVDVLKIERKK